MWLEKYLAYNFFYFLIFNKNQKLKFLILISNNQQKILLYPNLYCQNFTFNYDVIYTMRTKSLRTKNLAQTESFTSMRNYLENKSLLNFQNIYTEEINKNLIFITSIIFNFTVIMVNPIVGDSI